MLPPLLAGLALAGGLLLAAAPASAQAPDSVHLTGDVGVVNTAGNTDLTTVNVGEEVRWRRGPLTLGQMFALVYGRSGGETTSSLWRGGVRGDYALSAPVSAYVSATYDRDRREIGTASPPPGEPWRTCIISPRRPTSGRRRRRRPTSRTRATTA